MQSLVDVPYVPGTWRPTDFTNLNQVLRFEGGGSDIPRPGWLKKGEDKDVDKGVLALIFPSMVLS